MTQTVWLQQYTGVLLKQDEFRGDLFLDKPSRFMRELDGLLSGGDSSE